MCWELSIWKKGKIQCQSDTHKHTYLILPLITCLFMWLYFRYLKRSSMKTWWYYPKTMDNNLSNMLLLLLGVEIYFPLVGIIQNLFIDKCFFFWLLGWWSYNWLNKAKWQVSYYLNRSVYKTHSYMQSWNIS